MGVCPPQPTPPPGRFLRHRAQLHIVTLLLVWDRIYLMGSLPCNLPWLTRIGPERPLPPTHQLVLRCPT